MEFTFYERLAIELEEQGLSVASLIAAKARLRYHRIRTKRRMRKIVEYTQCTTWRYDGGEYEDGTTLDFNTGNIKEYRWKYMIKILMHPANKNKDKILEAMHQFYTNTAEEEQKKIPDHVDLSSKSYYNDRKIQGWVK
ncbi:OLC1v1024499C1 [Oldenlandia corymbosa var. corymbosa]|uniref:OLC1v1024499C1 n=1 Tax=Oldenlandia corymbosa var. corymbosa TaxID=529605 RepID=A0AAV1C5Y1_OLDCO|nr:OLC1v1024499C1 [Oldenlandia corymbosa var. corymbosa]